MQVIARLPRRLPACVLNAVRPATLASTPLVLAAGNDQQQLMQWLLRQVCMGGEGGRVRVRGCGRLGAAAPPGPEPPMPLGLTGTRVVLPRNPLCCHVC